MKKKWNGIVIALILGVLVVLSACTNNQEPRAAEPNQPNTENTKSVYDNPPKDDKDLANPLIIPSESGEKTETTNEYGTRYKGMGNNIYSTIGTSGVHEGGVSSYFESVLKGEGISGVKVFIVDDSVILARKKAETTSHEYDHMQKDVLSGTEGMMGKGEPQGVKGSQNPNDKTYDNLDQAQEMIDDMFNGNVKILTVTDPKAVDIINQIEDNIKGSAYQEATDDILKLLNMSK